MMVRTKETTITFSRPFELSSFNRPQPAGTYRLSIDEEEILGLTFLAYRHMATLLHTPAISIIDGVYQVFAVNSAELAAASAADERS
jgi:hypothetical protein